MSDTQPPRTVLESYENQDDSCTIIAGSERWIRALNESFVDLRWMR